MFLLTLKFLVCLLTGLAIKIADDILDEEADLSKGKKTWIQRAGKGSFVYAMLALAFAVALDPPLAISLFSASYIIGMIREPFKKQGPNIPAWIEILLVALICIFFFGWWELLGSIIVLSSIDLFDDLIDKFIYSARAVFFRKAILFLILILLSLLLDWRKTLLVYFALPFVLYLMEGRWNNWFLRKPLS